MANELPPEVIQALHILGFVSLGFGFILRLEAKDSQYGYDLILSALNKRPSETTILGIESRCR